MDYRKPVVFGENWSPSRYKVLPYFAVEKALLTRPETRRILDLGCAAGWNMSRFRQYGRCPVGLDVAPERVRLAAVHGPVMVASGRQIPLADGLFDVIYIQHVLHHIGDVGQALREVYRCLKPGGCLFLVETVEDNPLIRWGRRLHPRWLGDDITARFDFAGLQRLLAAAGFQVVQAQQYSVLFWLWEVLPDQIPFMEKLTPLFVAGERLLARAGRKYSAHCFLVAQKAMSAVGLANSEQ
ncbi:MAG: class I SAM-dependent methyltransferase [Chloroflexi bacterium]|nr:class I SAM-dependent methyltransferase [Chloroflexota bacterium]MCI0576115.1 class I SAM-dependent methyltransferase [Chloroflexota bacterium]MCI0647903.1 class I SAM-dependent methyltransferase [Chloroflexota bacterium]MCI0727154.1 class I SAM-dependent methyltransferase [Chloroflexota bacterium]